MEPQLPEPYIDIRDAAELTGYAVKYLKKLAKAGHIHSYTSQRSTMIAWSDVHRLANHQRPFWVTMPAATANTPGPDPRLLLYTEGVDHVVSEQRPAEYFNDKVEVGDCLSWMRQMPTGLVQAVVTSPPYWGVRRYPGEQQVTWADGSNVGLGEEDTLEEYVTHSLEVLRHLKRVLREDGTVWWNMGDVYQTRSYIRGSSRERLEALEGRRADTWREYPHKRTSSKHPYLKDKDLTLVPFLVAIGAEHLGFFVRSVIVWYKDNAVPEPVEDRPTTTHEYILLLAKAQHYKYDKNRDAETSVTKEVIKRVNGRSEYELIQERNSRTVWQFATSNGHGNHTAAFPLALPLRCLKLTTTPGDLVFDPFAGSGTSLMAARLVGCRYFGCDIDKGAVENAIDRVAMLNYVQTGNSPALPEAEIILAAQTLSVQQPLDLGNENPGDGVGQASMEDQRLFGGTITSRQDDVEHADCEAGEHKA